MSSIRQLALECLARHAGGVSPFHATETPVKHPTPEAPEAIHASRPVKHSEPAHNLRKNNGLDSITGRVFHCFSPKGVKRETPGTGGVSAAFADALAALASAPLEQVQIRRWRLCLDDARTFLDQWGEQAEALGWTARDLFGLDLRAPMARYDRMGLIWMLQGERIVAITNLAARLSGGLSFYRRRHG